MWLAQFLHSALATCTATEQNAAYGGVLLPSSLRSGAGVWLSGRKVRKFSVLLCASHSTASHVYMQHKLAA